MNILFIGNADFCDAGVQQMYHFADGIAKHGCSVLAMIPGKVETVYTVSQNVSIWLAELQFTGPFLSRDNLVTVRQFAPDVIHAFTPRHIPARVGWELKRRTGARLIIHYQDDEHVVYHHAVAAMGRRLPTPVRTLLRPLLYGRLLVQPLLTPLTWRGGHHWIARHPLTYALINRAAECFTAVSMALVDRLRQEWPTKKVYLLYPGADITRFNPGLGGQEIRAKYHLEGKRIIMYTGTLNLPIFEGLLQMLEAVAKKHPAAVFVHVGNDEFWPQALEVARARGLDGQVVFTGTVPHREIHRHLAAADVLVQHAYDLGNECRLPTKIPEYLAMGRPVVTFSAGIGRILEDGVDALKVYTDRPEEMAEKVLCILGDELLAHRLGTNARRKAEELFDWQKNTRILKGIYEEVLARPGDSNNDEEVLNDRTGHQ